MGRGIVARKQGDQFVKSNHKLQLQTVILEHDSTKISGTLANQKIQNSIYVNSRRKDLSSAIVPIFSDQNKNKIAFIKYFRNIKNKGFGQWTNAKFAKDTGYKMLHSMSSKETLPLSPRELVGSTYQLSPDEIYRKIENNIKNYQEPFKTDIFKLIEAISIGKDSPRLVGSAKYIQPYAKYLGEVLAPLAIARDWNIKGHKLLKNNNHYLYNINDRIIRYPINSNNELYDSKINNYLLSSKWLQGSEASLAGIQKISYEITENDQNPDIFPRFRDEDDILDTICSKSMYEGPLLLANEFEMIDTNDIIKFYKGEFTPKMLSFLDYYNDKDTLPNYQISNSILSAIAKQVCIYINCEYRFSDFIKEILSAGKIYQVNTVMRVDGDDLFFDHFKVIDPLNASSIELTSSKNYTSTRIRGKISFKIRE